MASPVFIGDEVTAAGFRLAGFDTQVPAPGEAGTALARARERSGLVLITTGCAATVSARELDEALRALSPLLVIVPDINRTEAPADMETRVRRLLGIES